MKQDDAAGRFDVGRRFENCQRSAATAGIQRGFLLGELRGVDPVDADRKEQRSGECENNFPALHGVVRGVRKRHDRMVCFRFATEAGGARRHLAIVSQSELILQRGEWKRNGKRVVCAAGAFDLLHPGHIRLLEQARGLGDIVVVALQSDASVRSSAAQSATRGGAGESRAGQSAAARPITPANERAEILTALAAVDWWRNSTSPRRASFLRCLRRMWW